MSGCGGGYFTITINTVFTNLQGHLIHLQLGNSKRLSFIRTSV
jgi:hypothetical protein